MAGESANQHEPTEILTVANERQKGFTKFERWQTVLRTIQAVTGLLTLLAAIWIGFKQTSINQSLYEMHFTPSVAVIWNPDDKRVHIINTGKENIWLWGIRFGNGQKMVEKEGRLISPGTFYYLFAEDIEREILDKVAPEEDRILPLEVYIKDGAQRPNIVKVLLTVRVSSGKMTIHAQTIAIDQTQW